MKLKTTHAVYWRSSGCLCRISIDSESRKVTLSEDTYSRWIIPTVQMGRPQTAIMSRRSGGAARTYSRWISRDQLKADKETAFRLLAVFEDYLEAHHQTDDDSIPDFESVEVELSDGPMSFGALWKLLRELENAKPIAFTSQRTS